MHDQYLSRGWTYLFENNSKKQCTELEHNQSLDTLVSEDIIRRTSLASATSSHLHSSRSAGGKPIHLKVNSSEPMSKHLKMDFSNISHLKSTSSSMSNKHLKAIPHVIR